MRDFAVKAGKPFWDSVYAKVALSPQDIGCQLLQGASPKRTAFDREIEGRVSCFSSTLYQPPSVSSVSLRLLRIQVKIGVSRSV